MTFSFHGLIAHRREQPQADRSEQQVHGEVREAARDCR
jgi:hypothetical protein